MDLYTSLIYTCELNGVNTFHDLTERELHAEELGEHPEEWMPWNDQAPLERMNAGPPCPVQPALSTPAEGAAAPNRPR